jgi:hypothetical protein
VVPEAKLEDNGTGLVPKSAGWFVLNARDARWFDKPGQGHSVPLTGHDEYEAETFFPMLGMAIRVMNPGEVSTTYHWETEQEDFLVLAGEALLIIETAAKYNAASPEDTQDGSVAYARFPPSSETRYPDGLLPG